MNQLVETALKLQQDAESARREAVTSLLGEQRAIGDQLKALGHIGQKATKSAAASSDKACSVCNAEGHDGRFHRRGKQTPSPLSTAP